MDSYVKDTKHVSPTCVLFILMLLGVAQMVQYCAMSLICASIPGNKYSNGVLFGAGEMFGMVFS